MQGVLSVRKSSFTQLQLYYLQEVFNTRLKAVRTEKEYLLVEIANLKKSLKHIHAEIPLKSIKSLPDIPTLNINVEFPERKVMVCINIFH